MKSTNLRIVALIVAFAVAGCSSVGFQRYTKWTPALLERVRLIPMDPAPYESLDFDADHHAFGPVANPVIVGLVTYEWTVEGDWLVLRDEKSGRREEYRLVNAGHWFITVAAKDGSSRKFRYQEKS